VPLYGTPMLPAVGKPLRLIAKAAAVGLNVLVAELLPPAVVPPLASLTAPVETATVTDDDDVGVPLTGQLIEAPTAMVAGGVGVHMPSVRPAGSAETLQDALVALAVAVAEFVHRIVPEYGTPTVTVAGRPDKSGIMSEPVTVSEADAVLLPRLSSFVELVVPERVTFPTAVGVPETVQVIAAPGASEAAGTVGKQTVVSPAGKPETAQLAPVAAIDGAAAFEQVNVPEYATPILAVAGKPTNEILMSELVDTMFLVAESLPGLVSFVAPVATDAVVVPVAVGMPDTGQEIDAPAASDATGSGGVHVPTVTPGGRPETAQVGLIAAAVEDALFVHNTVPA
jgi:hypothetical protein